MEVWSEGPAWEGRGAGCPGWVWRRGGQDAQAFEESAQSLALLSGTPSSRSPAPDTPICFSLLLLSPFPSLPLSPSLVLLYCS